MQGISDVNKSLIKTIIVLGITGFIIGAFFAAEIVQYGLGVAIGTSVSILKLILLEKALNKAVGMESQAAENYARLQYSARFFLTIVVIVISAITPFINMFGVLVGLVLVHPAVYITNLLRKEEIS